MINLVGELQSSGLLSSEQRYYSLHNNPEECNSQLLQGRSQKSHVISSMYLNVTSNIMDRTNHLICQFVSCPFFLAIFSIPFSPLLKSRGV